MDIQKIQHSEFMEVIPSGRLDEYWASHLEHCLEQVVRGGVHRIRLNMSSITYLSSAGIGILMKCYKQLHDINGSFTVIRPSPAVKHILDMTRLSPVLIADNLTESTPAAAVKPTRKIEHKGADFEVLDYLPGASMTCLAVGDPRLTERSSYGEQDVRRLSFPEHTIGLGLGAFGADFEDCRGRFGEFLAVAGAAAYLPTDGSNVSDYMLSAESFVPEVKVLFGLLCDGNFAHLARFEASKESRSTKLSDVIEVCLKIAASDAVAVAMVVEAAGLVGAVLRRSPASSPAAQAFSHPQIRNWISFTAEPAYAGSLCLLAGVAARNAGSILRPLLRSIGKGTDATGHFHAAAFRYQPLRKDEIDLRTTIRTLFETRSLQGILHVLADHRTGAGAGESQFLRGACWIAPLSDVQGDL
jgi:anti-anti-sigma factor